MIKNSPVISHVLTFVTYNLTFQSKFPRGGISEAIGTCKDFLEDVIRFLDNDMIPVEIGKEFKDDQYTMKGNTI